MADAALTAFTVSICAPLFWRIIRLTSGGGEKVEAVAFFALQAHHAVPVGERTVCHTKQRLFLPRIRLLAFSIVSRAVARAHRLAHHADPRAVKSIYLCVFVNLLQPFQAMVAAFQRTKGDVAALAFALRLQIRHQHIRNPRRSSIGRYLSTPIHG